MAPTSAALDCCTVLVVEEEALLAMDLADLLERQGCSVFGPAASVAQARALIDQSTDAAVLDLNLRDEPSVPVAQALSDRGVPFVVISGYVESNSSVQALLHAPRLVKPVLHEKLLAHLRRSLASRLEPQRQLPDDPSVAGRDR